MPLHTILIAGVVLAVAAFVILRGGSFGNFASVGVLQIDQMTKAFVPDRENTTVVVVRGWSRAEVNRILSDFLPPYDLSADSVRVTAAADGRISLTFPNDIQPKILYFLVNYIKYPTNLDFKHRSLSVVGHVVLNGAFGVPNPGFDGKRAEIYVPANDTDYDLVYAKLESGEAYKISFTDLIWQPVEDARTPKDIVGM